MVPLLTVLRPLRPETLCEGRDARLGRRIGRRAARAGAPGDRRDVYDLPVPLFRHGGRWSFTVGRGLPPNLLDKAVRRRTTFHLA